MELVHKLISAPADFLLHYVAPFVIVLSVLVFVHEWGHYIVARKCGVRVIQFSIGFGRELFGWTDKRGTRWKFSLIPLGGYVQMFGDTDPASMRHAPEEAPRKGKKAKRETAADAPQKPLTSEERKVAFFAQPVGRRAAIVFAGPAINYLFAIVLLTGLYALHGQPYIPPVAAGVLDNSPAAAAGIKPDDLIVAINGEKIDGFNDIRKFVAVSLDQDLEIQLRRSAGKPGVWQDKIVTTHLKPELKIETDRFGFRHSTGRIGISSPAGAMEVRQHTVLSALGAATMETARITTDTLRALGQMILGTRSADELGGILRIGAYAGDFAQQGILALINFMALLSVNLGFINLLPIPVLDGGHLAMYAMEKAKGKPLSEKTQEYALRVGLTVLLAVMLFATVNDLVQMRVIEYVKNLIS
jgi:regulator of sigma E protease